MTTQVLTSAEVDDLSNWRGLVAELARAHIALATGRAQQPTPVALRAPEEDDAEGAAVVPMLSFDADRGLFAMKVLADVPRNRSRGLPAQRSTVSLYDAGSGECLAVIDGRALTRLRTAAVTLLATRTLARTDARVLAVAGAGALALEHIRALTWGMPFEEVRIWSRSSASVRSALTSLESTTTPIRPAASLADLVDGADVVCTLTPAREPILRAAHLQSGMHVNAVGSPPRPAYTELEPAVFAEATRIAVDCTPVCKADSGNVRNALQSGAIRDGDLVELGAILAGNATGRTSDDDVTVFNSVGIGLQDLAAAVHVLDQVPKSGIGVRVNVRDAQTDRMHAS